MEIGVKQAAELLKVSEKTIYRWISSRQVPFYRVGAQYRFSRNELMQWAATDPLGNQPPSPPTQKTSPIPVSLAESLRAGGIFYRVAGTDVRSVIEEVVGIMRLPDRVDLGRVIELLCEREEMASTGLGDGIAFPHCRDIALPGLSAPILTLAFLEEPVDFFSIDNQPVRAVFTLLSPSAQASIRMMSRLAYAVRQPAFLQSIQEEAPRKQILAEAEVIDRTLDELTA